MATAKTKKAPEAEVAVDDAPEPPAAQPGDPGFDWQTEYPGEEVFVFTAADGRTVGLAALNDKRRPKPGVLRKLRLQNAVEQMWFVLERVASEKALEVSDDFDDEDYGGMFEAWSQWNQAIAGESSRSSAS